MFGHRSFLIIGGDEGGDIISLLKNGYEISSCQYSFQQGIDAKFKATTKVSGGAIHLTLSQLPPQPIIDWALRPRKYMDGIIVLVDAENVPLEKIFFKHAVCADMKVEYMQTGTTYMSTTILIHASQLILGDGVTFENEWVGH